MFIGKDIDLNSVYSMKVSLLNGDEKKYEVKRECYGYDDLLTELYREIKDDGLDISAVYNHFGDLKWRRNDNLKKKSKLRLYCMKIYEVIWPILQIAVAILPVIFMLSTNKTIWN